MVPRVWSLMRFLIKGSVAGGAVYLVYDQELLGPSDKSQAVLQRAEEVVPPAMYQLSQYVCEQTGLKMPQVAWGGVSVSASSRGLGAARLGPLGPSPSHLLLLPSLPSSQPLQNLTFTSVTPGTQVGPGPRAGG